MIEETKVYDEATEVLAYLEDVMPEDTRIFGEANAPSGTYVPEDGPAYCFRIRSWTRTDENEALRTISVQFKIFAADAPAARAAALLLELTIIKARSEFVLGVELETSAVILTEPDTGTPDWTYALVFYSFMLRVL